MLWLFWLSQGAPVPEDGTCLESPALIQLKAGSPTIKATIEGINAALKGVERAAEEAAAKLEATAPTTSVELVVESAGFDSGNFVKFSVGGIAVDHTGRRGFNIVVVSGQTGQVLDKGSFDVYQSSSKAADMVKFLNAVASGDYVMAAVLDEGSRKMTSAAYSALASIGGSGARFGHRESFALAGRKGAERGAAVEQKKPRRGGPAKVVFSATVKRGGGASSGGTEPPLLSTAQPTTTTPAPADGRKMPNHYRKENGIGLLGGKCTCPDGQVYNVGDYCDGGKTIACEGGSAGRATGIVSPYNHKVTCAPVTSCDETLPSGGKDANYRGCRSATRSSAGKHAREAQPCLPWASTPHPPSAYSDAGLTDGNGNYCRNPGSTHSTIWCYTSNVGDWDYCRDPWSKYVSR